MYARIWTLKFLKSHKVMAKKDMYAWNLNLEVFKILKSQRNSKKKKMYARNLNFEVFKNFKVHKVTLKKTLVDSESRENLKVTK